MKAESRRLFFALWPSDAVRESIQRQTQDAIAAGGGRIVPPRNYHVTLAFIGSVAAARVAEIEQAGAAIRAPRFDVTFTSMEFWPRAGVLCLTSSDPPAVMLSLAEALVFQRLNTPLQPYRPHVTVARDSTGAAMTGAIEAIRWAADDFVLCESHTRAGGAEYEVLARWPLG